MAFNRKMTKTDIVKDLFIKMGDHINVGSFPEGGFKHIKLSADKIGHLIDETKRCGGKVRACFDFGSVPSEEKYRDFADLLAAFEKMTGVRLSKDDFFFQTKNDHSLPNFDFVGEVSERMQMLVVRYYYAHQSGAKTFDDMLKVCDDTMHFHLFTVSD